MTVEITEAPQFEGFALSHGEYVATVEKIAKINERATKRGFTGRLEVVADRQVRESHDEITGLTKSEVVYVTRVTGTAPSYGGYQFLARVDAMGDSFTLATAPGVEHVERSLVKPGHCDHCGFNRNRKHTYLVANQTTGRVVNVGSTCIKDFLGWDANIVFFGSDEINAEIEVGSSTHYAPIFTVETVLAYAHAATRAFGWVAASSYSGRPTSEWVRLALGMYRPTEKDRQALATMKPFVAEATDRAKVVREFIASDEFSGTSTYVDNLKAACAEEVITSKQIGLVASAPQAYVRYLETEADRKAREAKWAAEKDATANSEFVGQPKDKIQVEGTIEAVRFIEGQYGTTTLYTIVGQDGNVYKWFSSNQALGTDEGVAVKIQGTVKKHDEYRGTKSTVLTRCKSI